MNKADHKIVQKVLDGEASAAEFADFQNRLRNEKEMFEFYRDYAHLHHVLHEELEDEISLKDYSIVSRKPAWRIPVYALVALLLVVGVAVWQLKPWEEKGRIDGIAVAMFSLDAVWSATPLLEKEGSRVKLIEGSELELEQGRGLLGFEPSIDAIIDGHVKLRMPSAKRIDLQYGKLYYEVERPGSKHEVKTTFGVLAFEEGKVGIIAREDGTGEFHVFSGKVMHENTSGTAVEFVQGDAVAFSADGASTTMAANESLFRKGLGRFRMLRSGNIEEESLELEYGSPTVLGPRVDGENFSVFYRLPEHASPESPPEVLLVSLEAGKPTKGEFHTDGWAGVSFFSGKDEVAFVGDSYGTRKTWSLDLKQGKPLVEPEDDVEGPRDVTVRYDPETGEISLHKGKLPLEKPFCEGVIAKGLIIDRLRIAASAGAAFTLKSFEVRVEEE